MDAVFSNAPLMQKADSVNISTDGQISMKDVIYKISSLMNYNGEILNKPARGADVEAQ